LGQTMMVLSSLVLVAAAVATYRRWRRDRSSGPARWSLATFSILGAVVAELAITELLEIELDITWTKALIAVLAFFPYALFRFARSFEGIFDRWDRAALALTVGVAITALVLPDLGEEAGSDGVLRVYLLVLLAQWTVLSVAAALRLWRAGSGLPAIGRSRMRLIGGAAVGLNVAILLTLLPQDGGLDDQVQTLVFLTSLLFFLGISPPPFLRHYWRQADRMTFEQTVQGLMGATTSEQIGEVLLGDAIALVGAESAELVDGRGASLARARREADEKGSGVRHHGDPQQIALGHDGLVLLVWLSPYAPYFGPEEAALLRTVGALARLSLERNALFEEQAANLLKLEEARADAERASLAKNDFLSRMSHELRTPLNSILGYSQLLDLDDLGDDQRESVKQIERAGRHLLDLINEVLDLSRIEAGRLSVSLEPVPVTDLIDECVALMRPLAEVRDVSLGADIQEDAWDVYVRGDRQRLKQVLINLLSNAVKYNRLNGSVTVTCRSAEMIEVSVSDTGLGIPATKLERLFVAFDRLDIVDEQEEGTGLGLSVSRNLVHLMGGELKVDSEVGRGSRFTIRLPRAEAEGALASARTPPDRAAAGTYGASRILAIEDNAANVRLLERILRLRPLISLLSAPNGEEGIAMARSTRPDLILLDVNLPDVNGDMVLTRLRGDPRTQEIPVIFVSADATDRQIEKLMEAGAAAYVTKPLEVDQFLTTVDRVLAEYATEDVG